MSIPSSIITARRTSDSRRHVNSKIAALERSTNSSATVLFRRARRLLDILADRLVDGGVRARDTRRIVAASPELKESRS